MRASESIITIVENLVSQMTPVVTITANVDNLDGTFTLSMCPTYWLMPNMTITIDGNDYVIESFVQNESITVSGSVQPVVTTFQLAAPEFRHGARRKVNNERKGEFDLRSIWVYLPIPEILEDNDLESDISYTADIRPIFLKDYNKMRDTIDLQQDEVIEPLNAAADYFIELINNDYETFNEPPSISRREWMNFGNPTVWGNDELIFDQPLSGVETRMSLEVLENGVCGCDAGEIDNCPDVTTSVEGTPTTADTAPGQNIDIQIVDLVGNTVPSTLTEDTPNTKKLEVNTGGDPVSVDFNTVPTASEPPAGSTFDVSVKYANGTPVGTVTTETDDLLEIEIPNPATPKAVGALHKSGCDTSYNSGDEADVPYGVGADFFILDEVNEFNNLYRFTGTTGGGTDGTNYFDVNGNSTTKALAFPNDVMLDWSQYNQKAETVPAIGFAKPVGNYNVPTILTFNEPDNYNSGYGDWKPWTFKQSIMWASMDINGVGAYEYKPIEWGYASTGDRIWTRTPGYTANNYMYWNGTLSWSFRTETSTLKYIMTRDYTLTELGL